MVYQLIKVGDVLVNKETSFAARSVVVTDYADVGPCVELIASNVSIKTNDTFTSFAIMVAQQIADSLKHRVKVTWGKWGARLEQEENKRIKFSKLCEIAHAIVCHPSWVGLALAADVLDG